MDPEVLIKQLQQKVEELTTVIEASKKIRSTLDLRLLLSTIMQLGTKVMHAETSSLMLLDEEKQELVFEVIEGGEQRGMIKEIRLGIDEGVAGWVVRNGEPVLVLDAEKDERFCNKMDIQSGFKTKSLICIPLKVKDKVIGIAEVINKKDEESFSPEDMSLFSALADQAAIAIENAKLYKDMQELFLSTIKSLATAIEAKDPYTKGHSERVTNLSMAISRKMGMPFEDRERLQIAALLHDVGKIGVPEAVLGKPGKLNDEEWKAIKQHPAKGEEILKPIKQLSDILPVIRHHHEKYGGGGYPDGIKAQEIPLASRIITVADSFDAMASERPYRPPMKKKDIMQELERCKGTQFDPKVIEAFVACYEYK
ncbi:MAG: HD domain-containing phosphohydrolase [bacterium]